MFTTPLEVRATAPGRWVLLKRLIWWGREKVIVPAGFETDLASIPRPLRAVLNQNGRSRRPAVLHDYLYRFPRMSRAASDKVFRTALLADGALRVVAVLYWLGVRAGGWLAWKPRK